MAFCFLSFICLLLPLLYMLTSPRDQTPSSGLYVQVHNATCLPQPGSRDLHLSSLLNWLASLLLRSSWLCSLPPPPSASVPGFCVSAENPNSAPHFTPTPSLSMSIGHACVRHINWLTGCLHVLRGDLSISEIAGITILPGCCTWRLRV